MVVPQDPKGMGQAGACHGRRCQNPVASRHKPSRGVEKVGWEDGPKGSQVASLPVRESRERGCLTGNGPRGKPTEPNFPSAAQPIGDLDTTLSGGRPQSHPATSGPGPNSCNLYSMSRRSFVNSCGEAAQDTGGRNTCQKCAQMQERKRKHLRISVSTKSGPRGDTV